MKRALQVILVFGLAGLAFSGYLTYRELFAGGAAVACTPVGEPGTIAGYPPCIYGFVMYAIIVAVAAGGLLRYRLARG